MKAEGKPLGALFIYSVETVTPIGNWQLAIGQLAIRNNQE